MNALSFDTIHKNIDVKTDKEELEKIAYWLNSLDRIQNQNHKFTPKAIEEIKQKAIELLTIARDMHKEELNQYNEDLKDMKKGA